mmetsp:Transcript_16001/g.18086  ORF Transcript_16001/g.18086 Transcript_16001/m.18086 type:complete len:161 (-) Transcript_16001:338-820(-)
MGKPTLSRAASSLATQDRNKVFGKPKLQDSDRSLRNVSNQVKTINSRTSVAQRSNRFRQNLKRESEQRLSSKVQTKGDQLKALKKKNLERYLKRRERKESIAEQWRRAFHSRYSKDGCPSSSVSRKSENASGGVSWFIPVANNMNELTSLMQKMNTKPSR